MRITVKDPLRDAMVYAQNKIDYLAPTYNYEQWYHLSQASLELEKQRQTK